jgi:hypothetical protein
MQSRFLLLAALALSTGACASSNELQASLERYKGDPVSELVPRLGPPSGTSSGTEGPAYVWATGSSLTGSSSSCALGIYVDGDQRITAGEWAGNYGACRYLSQRLQGQY